jgi:hypothetical protein
MTTIVEVHPIVIDTVTVRVASIVEYQVRQTERGVAIDVVVDGRLDQAALASAIEESLRTAGLANSTATVRVVVWLARPTETGKIRRFVALE